MGLFTYTVAGAGFVAIGIWEALLSSSETLKVTSSPSSPPPPPSTLSSSTGKTTSTPFSSSITFGAISLLSFLFILNSLISIIDALNFKDSTGVVLQLEVIAIASLFLLYSLLGFLTHLKKTSFQLPSPVLGLLYLFAFVEEFFLFYLQRKDPSGIENRYFDLLLVPIGVCVFSTVLELKTPKSNIPRLGRGVGLISQGMWFIQMGFSIHSNLMAHGCSLNEKSRGNYTVRCKGHPEYHRGRAIATLQFNCHLALLVVLSVAIYSVICRKHGVTGDFTRYRPIGAEMQQLDGGHSQFTLDSDDDFDNEDGVREEAKVGKENTEALEVVPELGVNGYGSHQ